MRARRSFEGTPLFMPPEVIATRLLQQGHSGEGLVAAAGLNVDVDVITGQVSVSDRYPGGKSVNHRRSFTDLDREMDSVTSEVSSMCGSFGSVDGSESYLGAPLGTGGVPSGGGGSRGGGGKGGGGGGGNVYI